MTDVLVIGYGNPLRRDDGLGWVVANHLAHTIHDDTVQVIAAHQLLPEMAEVLSQATFAIFVDAGVEGEPGKVQTSAVTLPQDATLNVQAFTHAITPERLLHLAAMLYQKHPPAVLVTVTGADFGYGDGFSETVAALVPTVIEHVQTLMATRRIPR